MIQAIVSDLGQVLLRFDYEPCWQKILPTCDHPEARAQFRTVLTESRFGCGQVEPQEFYRRVAAAMRTRMSYEEFRVAWSDMFWEDQEVIEMIERAPVRHRLILSNTNAIHWSWIEERYGHVLSRFDRSLVSHECGFEKPAPEIYQFAIRHTGLPPAAHLFIDDLAHNVEGARAAGMDAVLHTDAASLRAEFQRRGLVPLSYD